ncbi:MAG: GDSL-type esterase/lipase family protein [Pseudobacter sp.]|uniref:SGNH/GDSL hydrolase family protein n=1 Tax=Pseudobacter sp. TaxID=2045420 RepID=UPI003F7D804E
MKLMLKILVFTLVGQSAMSQIYSKPNNSYGLIWNRGRFDSAAFLPTGCGVPLTAADLRSTDQNMMALQYDSCGHKMYLWDPKLKSWYSVSGATQLSDSTFKIGLDTIKIIGGSNITASNGASKVGNDIRWGRQLGSGTTGAELLYDTEIPLNGQRLFFTSPSGLAETSITKHGIEIFGSNFSNGLSRIRMLNSSGGSFEILKGPTGATINFEQSQIFVRDSDGNLIFTKTPGTSPTAFHDVDGSGRYRDTLTITTMGDADSSDRAASTAWGKRAVAGFKDSVLGVIYSSNNFANLNDFVNRGATASATGGKISFSGGIGTFGQTLEYARPTLLEKWHVSVLYIPTEKTSTSFGAGPGIRSTNSSAVNVMSKFDATTGADAGKLFIYTGTGTLVKTSETAIAFNAYDNIELHMERVVDTIYFWAINRTQNIVSAKLAYGYSFASGVTSFTHNTGRFAVYSYGGTFDIAELKITSDVIKRPDVLIIGDSKAAGYFVDSPYDRWGVRLRNVFPKTVIQAGSADKITDAQSRIDETISILPKQVILSIGVNDIRAGTDSATIKTNYGNYVAALQAAGAKVFHLLSLKEVSPSTVNADWFNNYIVRTWPNEYFDSTFKYCSDCITPADGTHVNVKGNRLISDVIINSGKIQGTGLIRDNSINAVLAQGNTTNIPIIIGDLKRLGGVSTGSFSQPKLILTSPTYPSIVMESGTTSFGGGSIVWKTNRGGPKLNPALFGDSVGFAMVGHVYDNNVRQLAFLTADNTNNTISAFVLRQAANDFNGTRSRVTAQAGQNLYAGFELSGTTRFGTTPAVFAVNAFNQPVDIYNLPSTVRDTTKKLLVRDRTTGEIFDTNWPVAIPSTTAGSVLFSNGTTIAQDNANFFWDAANVRLGLGTNTPVASALLDITSTTKGVLFPRMNTTQQNAISSPATGLWIYNTDSSAFRFYNGGAWVTVGGSVGGGGGSGTVTTVGKTDANGFAFTITNPTTTPNISLTTSLTTGSVPVIGASGALTEDNANFNYTSGQLGIGTNSQASKLHIQTGSLGAYTTSTTPNSAGIILSTPTAAANSAQQYGPSLVFRSNGWGTTAGTSQPVDWMVTNKATQGATPTSSLAFKISINGGSYSEAASIRGDGVIFAGGVSATGGLTGSTITAGSTSNITWSTRSVMTSPADGNIRLTNAAATDFGLLQFGGTTSSFPAWQRSGTGLIARLADNSANTSITASGLTLSGLTGTGTRLSTTSSTGVSGAITNGTDGQVMTLVSGAPAWADKDFDAGTYTPTFSNLGTGVSGITLPPGASIKWQRVKKTVTIWGNINPAFSSGSTGDIRTWSMSLPPGITAVFTQNQDAAGIANCGWKTTRGAIVQADSANDIIGMSVEIGTEGFGATIGYYFTVSFEIP